MKTILDKLGSGRYVLTVIGGAVFAYTACLKIMPPEAVASILSSIFVSYFSRSDRKPEENGGGQK